MGPSAETPDETPIGSRGACTRERILAAAEREFSERGFAGGTTRRIAVTANVPEGLLFYYFRSKRALLDALLEERTLGVELSELAAEASGERDPHRLLRKLGRRMWEGLKDGERFARIIVSESHLDDSVKQRLLAMQQERVAFIARAIDDATSHTLDPEHAREMARLFLGSLVFAVAIDPPEDPDAFLARTVEVLLGPAPAH